MKKLPFGLLGLAFLATVASCNKQDSVPVSPSATTHSLASMARQAGDNYDNSDVFDVLRRVHHNDPTVVPVAGKIVKFDINWGGGAVVHYVGHDGHYLQSQTSSNSYSCSKAASLCDLISVTVTSGKVILSDDPYDPDKPEHEEIWKNVELLPSSDVIVCTPGEPTYYANSHIVSTDNQVHTVVPN